jgi:hypothetical protein
VVPFAIIKCWLGLDSADSKELSSNVGGGVDWSRKRGVGLSSKRAISFSHLEISRHALSFVFSIAMKKQQTMGVTKSGDLFPRQIDDDIVARPELQS